MKTLEECKKEIQPERYYRPMEIKLNGWIVNPSGKPDYFYILKLIKLNRIRAKDFGLGKTPYYRILGSEIIRFLED